MDTHAEIELDLNEHIDLFQPIPWQISWNITYIALAANLLAASRVLVSYELSGFLVLKLTVNKTAAQKLVSICYTFIIASLYLLIFVLCGLCTLCCYVHSFMFFTFIDC